MISSSITKVARKTWCRSLLGKGLQHKQIAGPVCYCNMVLLGAEIFVPARIDMQIDMNHE